MRPGLPIRDVTAGFCCYRCDALEAIRLERVRSSGYVFQVKMKLRVWHAGLEVRSKRCFAPAPAPADSTPRASQAAAGSAASPASPGASAASADGGER